MSVPAIPYWIHRELQNWGAECRSGPWPHPIEPDHAMSLEGGYIRDSALELEEINDEKAARPPKPDARKAAVVQAVYDNSLTTRERRVLVDLYVMIPSVSAERTVQELRISTDMYQVALAMAARQVGRAITAARTPAMANIA